MTGLFTFAALLQGLLITVDEFVFHRKRGLPRWERLGHPADSISFLIPLALLMFTGPTDTLKPLYVAAAAFSCLCVTKDEWVHHSRSTPTENWIHAMLFILHPVILIAGYQSWAAPPAILPYFFSIVVVFTLYQIVYWNYYENRTVA